MKKKDLECKAFYPSLEEPYQTLFEGCQYPWEALPKIKTWISAMQGKLPSGFQEVKKGVFVHESVKLYPNVYLGENGELRSPAGSLFTGKCICRRGLCLGK